MVIWKDVVGAEGYYEVSDFGEVRRKTRTITVSPKGKSSFSYVKNGGVIKPRLHQFGYLMVTLSIKGKILHKTVHSIVAEAFIGPRPDGMYVCHNDGDPKNNHYLNLRYDTPSSNNYDAIRHGTRQLGENHYSAKFSKANVIEMRERYANNESIESIAKYFNANEMTVRHIVFGLSRRRDGGPIAARKWKNKFLSEEEKVAVLELRKKGLTIKQLSEKFGVSRNQIHNLVRKNNEG